MRYSPAQYSKVLYDLMKESSPTKRRDVIRDFLGAMEKNGALSLLPEVMWEFGSLLDAKNKIHTVTVWSTKRLSEAGIARKFPFRSRVESMRDIRLVGGAVVEVDGLRVDSSVAGRLARVREALTK